MNKILSIKSNAIFLAVILVVGTIAAFSPSFMVGTVQAEPYYGMDKTYKKSSGKDVSVKSIKCNNVNVNVNGLELNLTSVPLLGSLLTSEAQADEGERDTGPYGNGERDYVDQSISNKNFKFVCINNNNNTVIGIDDEGETPIQTPTGCTDCFLSTTEGGPIPPELHEILELHLAGAPIIIEPNDVPRIVSSIEGLCELIDANGGITEASIRNILIGAFITITDPVSVINEIVECLREKGLIISVSTPMP